MLAQGMQNRLSRDGLVARDLKIPDEERIHKQNPNAKIIYISAKTGEGFEEWVAWLKNKLRERTA